MNIKKIFLESIDSTNTYAITHGSNFGRDALTCIVAEEQLAGRGQFGRTWISPKGVNLYATLYFHLPSKAEKIEELALFMAKCLKSVLEQQGVHPTMKWPNDLLLNGKKLAGVLCETVFHPDHIEIILGFGLNVNMEAEDLAKVDQKATSLKQETGRIWDKNLLLDQILTRFHIEIRTTYKIF